MAGDEWVSVAEYQDAITAQVFSELLTGLVLLHRLYSDPGGNVYIWVPPAQVEAAKEALNQSVISDSELAELAMREPSDDS